LVSAHAGQLDPARSLAAGPDYVELDIRRTADGELVAVHDADTPDGHLVAALPYARLCDLAGAEVPRVRDILALIRGRARGHLDLKVTGGEEELVRLALDILGPGQFVVTTAEDSSVAAIRSRFTDPDAVPVALSLGRRVSELRPLPRVRACGANWVAVNQRLALAGVAWQCRRAGLTVMVWTVNGDRDMRYWLAGRADVLITDRPAHAIALRSRVA
jgi:glycerophosphoryl diester phosphodiesterase